MRSPRATRQARRSPGNYRGGRGGRQDRRLAATHENGRWACASNKPANRNRRPDRVFFEVLAVIEPRTRRGRSCCGLLVTVDAPRVPFHLVPAVRAGLAPAASPPG